MRNLYSVKVSIKYFVFGLALIFFSGCRSHYSVQKITAEPIEVNNSIATDETSDQMISSYRVEMEKTMNAVICQTRSEMVKGRPESLLGNLIADLGLKIGREIYGDFEKQGIDFCLFNTGGLRASLPKGDISRGKVFELMPFENELVVVTLSQKGMAELIEYVKARGGDPLSGIRIDFGQDPYRVDISGVPLNENRNYKVLTTDYLANGGDKMKFLTKTSRLKIDLLDMKMRDAIMLHFERLGNTNEYLKSELDGRIKF